MSEEIKIKHFKPKAHILRLLGDELIKSPVMAIYELVKNSYDADSSYVNVKFLDVDDENSSIISIEDDGTGLTEEVIENVWLEPGTDYRKPIDNEGNRIVNRSPIYKRVPMGEKGVGRFAVHKLGNKITLISRPSKVFTDEKGNKTKVVLDYEITLTIDWKVFSQSKYLEDIPISWNVEKDNAKFHFQNNAGTLIQISSLKEPWTRGMARSLKRNTVSMLSPKNDENKFVINLDFGNDWLNDFPDADEILKIAPYKYTALLDENYNLTVDYSFHLELNKDFGSRTIGNRTENIKGLLIPLFRKEMKEEHYLENDIEDFINRFEEKKNLFGNILFEIYSYDLDPETLRNYSYDSKTLKDVLSLHSGIKVFKDEMRVFNYGEAGNDWLELDIKRVQSKQWFSNNQNIGFVYLDSENSTSLIEKTNREGFIDNEAFKIFYKCISQIINDFRIERNKDRVKWLDSIKTSKKTIKIVDQTSLFNDLIDSTDFSDFEKREKLKEEVKNLQNDFEEKRDTLLIPAGVGMTASVALHEIEKLVPRLREVINTKPFNKDLGSERVDELNDYVQGILSVLRKGGDKPIELSASLNTAISNYDYKFKTRKISVQKDFDESISSIICDKRYFITMIMNIIDNSIYWMDTTYNKDKRIYIKTYIENDYPTIVIVDNGPGFKDEIIDLVRPFFSRKSDGIGIGLYLIDTLMMKYGKFQILDKEELEEIKIPQEYRGAAVRLIFNKS